MDHSTEFDKLAAKALENRLHRSAACSTGAPSTHCSE